MPLISLVASHADHDLDTIARLSMGGDEVAVDATAHDAVAGAVVLSTCNRYEVYCEVPHEHEVDLAVATVADHVARRAQADPVEVAASLTVHRGSGVASHLFRVAAGLDSVVVGEREVAGQVRRALDRAQATGTASGELVRLFQAASKAAKDVGRQTDLGSHGLSIVSVALDLAAADHGVDWSTASVLLLGTGAYAGATIAALRQRGCIDVRTWSASGRAVTFAAERGAVALDASHLDAALGTVDVVIGSSGGGWRLDADHVARCRRSTPVALTVIDLALTHDIDPEVGRLEQVRVIDLESVRRAAPPSSTLSLHRATDIVAEAAREWERATTQRAADEAIVALRRHTMQALDREVARVRRQHGCTAAAEEVEFALRRMVRELLHVPTVRARELAAQGRHDDYLEALEALYGITLDPAGSGSAVRHERADEAGPGTRSA